MLMDVLLGCRDAVCVSELVLPVMDPPLTSDIMDGVGILTEDPGS